MNFKKSELMEIIDSNGDLIGKNDVPTSGSDLETQASNTTDYNAKVGTQPFRYDMLGRFGFTLMPFMEGKSVQEQSEFMQELISLMHSHYAEILEYYYRNPNKLKPDFRKSQEEGHGHSDECEKRDIKWANEVMEKIQKELENAFKNSKQIDETDAVNEGTVVEDKVVEDKLVDKKTEDEMSNRSADKDVQDKKLEKIAGLINKLDQKDIDKLKNLLERK